MQNVLCMYVIRAAQNVQTVRIGHAVHAKKTLFLPVGFAKRRVVEIVLGS